MEVFSLPLTQLQPSQLYISEEKLARVLAWWQPPTLHLMEPLPVKQLNGRVIFTDGHTRAFAAYRRGFERVPVYWDEDKLDWEAYQVCVDWCLDEGIRTIAGLEHRVISPARYEDLWLNRCRAMQTQLALQRAR